jgi:uncharacterized membrane protein
VLAALSTGHKLGLGLSALAFIAFALLSAMVIPRTRPDFPRRVGLYVLVTVLFFIGMMAAVFIFGKEEKEPAEHESALALRL